MQYLRPYSIFCATEGKFVDAWTIGAPTTCPNNAAHKIDVAQTSIVDAPPPQSVYIESIGYKGTQGFYMMQGDAVDVPANADEAASTRVFPVPVAIRGVQVHATADHVGDSFDMTINPGTTVGGLTEDAEAGATVLHVTDTVVANVFRGFSVSIVDTVTGVEQDLGVITGIVAEKVDGDDLPTITVSTPLTTACPSATCVIKVTLYVARGIRIAAPGRYDVGYGTLGSKPLPAGTACCLTYHAATPAAAPRALCYAFEYTY